jgi:hypothetical protein
MDEHTSIIIHGDNNGTVIGTQYDNKLIERLIEQNQLLIKQVNELLNKLENKDV